MIITNKEAKNTFKQIEINIIIEDIDEARVWYSLFDNSVLKQVLGFGNCVELRTGLTDYYSWDAQKQVDADLIKAFYDTYKEEILELIDSELLG
jgi:hypothetical protein